MAPKADIFRPPAEVSFSKSQVTKAGRLLRKFYGRDVPEEQMFDGWDVDKLVDAMTAVEWWRLQHAQPLSRVAANLRYHVDREGGLVDGKIEVTQRLKRRATILNKLQREPHMALGNMADIGGVRSRLPSLRHVAAVSRRIKKNWMVVDTKDYIAKPKQSGYRALHHIVRRSGRLVEVQLRTLLQDVWANQVEEDSRRLGVGYKFGGGADEVHGYYLAMSEAFALQDRGEGIPDDLALEINERFARVREELGRETRRRSK